MSLKLRFFIFSLAIAIFPTFIIGWTRVNSLATALGDAGLSPQASSAILKNIHESTLALGLTLAIFASFFSFALFRSFAEPVTQLAEAMRLIRTRDFSAQVVPTTSSNELEELANTFNDMARELKRHIARLEDADRSKDNFIAIMAHELRNPMAPIVTNLELLRMKKIEDEGVAKKIATIDRQVETIRRLLDYLLDVSRLKQGRVVLNKTHIDFCAVITYATETVDINFAAKRQKLTLNIPSEPIHMEGDTIRLEQVLVNLLRNASEHSPMDGVITLDAARVGDTLVVSVGDRGTGIDKEDLGEIFTLFARGASSAHKPGGLGVGLYLVKTFVELHGGTVAVTSDGPGMGATFTLRIPLNSSTS